MSNNLIIANRGMFLLMAVSLPFDNALFHLASFFTLFTSALTFTVTGKEPLMAVLARTKYIQIGFIAIAAIMFLSNAVNLQQAEAWRTMLIFAARYWLMLVVFLYLYECRILTLRFIFAAAVVSVSVQFVPFISSIWDGTIFHRRFEGFTSNSNIAGLYAGFGALLGLLLVLDKKTIVPLRLAVALPLIAVSASALIATGNRGGWVALIGAMVVIGVLSLRDRYKIILPSFVLLAAVGGYIFSQFALPKTRLELLLKGYPALRDQVWENTLTLFVQNPVLGMGLDTRAALLQNHSIYSEHNVFLSVLLALGSVGFAAYVFLLYQICWPALMKMNAAGLSLMAFLLGAGMFGFDFYRDQHFMTCFVVVTLACVTWSKREARSA